MSNRPRRLLWIRLGSAAPSGEAAWERRALELARGSGFRVRVHRIDQRGKSGAGDTEVPTQRSASPKRFVPGRSHLVGLVRVWAHRSLGPNGVTVARRIARMLRASISVARLLIGALREAPRSLRRLLSGPPSSVDPFPPALQGVCRVLETERAGAGDRLVLVGEGLDLVRFAVQLQGLDISLPGQVIVALREVRLSEPDRLRHGQLGGCLESAAQPRALHVAAVQEEERSELASLLGRRVLDVAALQEELRTVPPARPHSVQPMAVVVRTPWVMCGSSVLFANQSEFLREHGYFVLEVVVNDLVPAVDAEGAWRQFQIDNRQSRAHLTALLNLRLSPWTWLRLLVCERAALRRSRLARRAAVLRRVEVPPTLARLRERRKPVLAIVNHCFNVPVARMLFPHTPVILESQDVQAEQIELQHESECEPEKRRIFDVELEEELRLAKDARAIVSVNERETEFFSAQPGLGPVFTVHPYLVEPPRMPSEGPAARALIDVLLVASDNAGNVASVDWFQRHVAPILVRAGVEIVVVGNVDRALPSRQPSIRFEGRVDDVGRYYASARLVALPVREGTGIAIKTIEALSLGKPVVATSPALRGISDPERFMPTFDEPKVFADEVLRLLSDPAALEERASEAASLAKIHYSKNEYFRRWDRVLAEVLDLPDELGGLP